MASTLQSRRAAAGLGVAVAMLSLLFVAARPNSAIGFRIATGAYIPGIEDNPDLIEGYAETVGRAPLIVSAYRNWSEPPFDPRVLDAISSRGAVPMVTWEPWDDSEEGVPLWSIATGGYDHYLSEAARTAAAWGQPVFLRFAHEMNGNWYPWGWGVGGNTPAAYKAAWRHVVEVFRAEGAANVLWVWCPYVSNVRPRQFKRFYPGDEWVDWAGLDGFNWGAYRTWQSFDTIFALSYRRLIRVTSRPLMIGEVAVGEAGGDKPRWIATSLLRKLPRYNHVRALVWFDAADHRADFRVDSSPRSLSAIREAFAARLFSSNRSALLATPPHLKGAGR